MIFLLSLYVHAKKCQENGTDLQAKNGIFSAGNRFAKGSRLHGDTIGFSFLSESLSVRTACTGGYPKAAKKKEQERPKFFL